MSGFNIGVLFGTSVESCIMFPRIKARRARANPRVRFQPWLTVLETRALLATFVVNSLGDTGAGSGLTGDLRYCLTRSNQSYGLNTIDMTHVAGMINLTTPLPAISNSVAIMGPGAANLTVYRSGSRSFRVFSIDPRTNVSISGLTLAGGAGSGNGGAIDNSGFLRINNATIMTSSAQDGGGIANETGGVLTIVQAIVTGNSATQQGGGVFNRGLLIVQGSSTFSMNQAGSNAAPRLLNLVWAVGSITPS